MIADILALLRLVSFVEWLKTIFVAYQVKKKSNEVSDVQASVNQLSDSDVANELRKYDRPDGMRLP